MKCEWGKTALQLQNIYRKKQFCSFLEGLVATNNFGIEVEQWQQ